MEETPGTNEAAPGPYANLIELIVEEGICSIQAHEGLREECVQGGIEGFEQCRDMKDSNITDFELALIGMEEVDKTNRINQISREEYWRHRYATLQVEHCYEILRVAHKDRTGSLPDDQRKEYSACALMRYGTLTLALQQ